MIKSELRLAYRTHSNSMSALHLLMLNRSIDAFPATSSILCLGLRQFTLYKTSHAAMLVYELRAYHMA